VRGRGGRHIKLVWCDSRHPEGNNRLVGWLEGRLGYPISGPVSTLGVFDRYNDLIAVVAYHDYSRRCGVCQMSAASTTARWLTREVLYAMFAHAFLGLGCQAVVLRVSEKNERMLSILKRFGFSAHRLPRLRGRHEDEVLNILTDDQWKANGFCKDR
jgi:RimJ/RimL family protein N-acetyltransferase